MLIMEQSPNVGEISADGLFRWDGREWMPLARAPREPTSWTRPLRYAAATFLGLAAIQSVVSTALFLNAASLERVARVQSPSLGEDQLREAANVGLTLGWFVVVVTAALMLLLAAGSLLGWRWAFWAVLAWLALTSIGVITNLVALSHPATQTQPPASLGVGLLFCLAALVLAVWFVVAAARYGPWAMRRPGRAG
jgi:hypothetical protein